MSSERTTLGDFASNDSVETTTEEVQNQTESDTKEDQSDEKPSDELPCQYYTAGMKKCRERLNKSRINDLNIDKIGCGHCIDYISEEVGAKIAESTAEGYSSYLRQYVEFLHTKSITVAEAEFKHVKQYFNQLANSNRSESTIEAHRTALTNVYKHISIYTDVEATVDWLLIREEIRPSDYRTPEAREREPLEKSEVKKLYDELGSFRNRLMAQLGVETGARSVDIRSSKVSDIDFENKEIQLSNTKAGGTYTVPISDQLLLLLRRWIDQERKAQAKAGTTDYLFPSKFGGKVGKSGFCKIVKEAAESAGIQETVQSEAPMSERQKKVLGTNKDYKEYHKVTPHTLRHTFNHLLTEAGIPREARSKALDHNSEEVTQEFYDHQESNYKELMCELFSTKGSLID